MLDALKIKLKSKLKKEKKFKKPKTWWWNLKSTNQLALKEKLVIKGVRTLDDNVNTACKVMICYTMIVVVHILAVSKGRGPHPQESRWWTRGLKGIKMKKRMV